MEPNTVNQEIDVDSTKVTSSDNASRELLIVVGEASGDQHAAGVVRELKRIAPNIVAFGMGGSQLRSAGMDLVVDAEESAAVMGFTEVFGSLGKIIKAYRALVAAVETRRPAVAILVDFPDFNFFVARAMHRRKIPVIYFISPQLWAWRKGRIKTIKKYVKRVLPIFPFEEHFYHRHGVAAEYVGHPFIDREDLKELVGREFDRTQFLRDCGLSESRPVVALLPGSRRAEVSALLPEMLKALTILRRGRPGLQAILPVAHSLDINWIRQKIAAYDQQIAVVEDSAVSVLKSADVAVVASGTATVEAALVEVPFVVVYRLSKLSYAIGKVLIRGVSYIAMANLIAGKKVVEELIQDQANGERIAEEVERIIGDPGKANLIKNELSVVRKKLTLGLDTSRTVSERVATIVLEMATSTSQGKSQSRLRKVG